ncbi:MULTISPECIES: endolytic transglycosylase MltG [unclassified Granulicatella]|uniref:endolytic transglycosylase MltG n=1 Tax=unclassified Granulicatella TaxID=2630493 RepID=UPI001074673B|nr:MULTISPECIES: endolytic transglycosylase MltG [unclassified Granulicatella]MBF0779839.1 endolytic transglycosylase MltG [Granulicatella sp. 19428wC4_WM01]TFU96139.1 endolytic transglycosylase MltG [Granulicatella sp. WM01]
MSDKNNITKQFEMKKRRQERENGIAKRITWIIVTIVLCILMVVGVSVYQHIHYNLQPYNIKDKQTVDVQVEQGMTLSELAAKLENMKLIRSATLFNLYLKTKDVGLLQAGHYSFSPSMTLDEMIGIIKEGGANKAIVATILVREGEQITDIAQNVADKTPFTKDEFLDMVKNEAFVKELVAKYPDLLTSMSQTSQLKYALEGYLFPATYNYYEGDTLKDIIQSMVEKSAVVIQPYIAQIKDKGLSVHQVLTIASLAEKEGVTMEDRKKIVGVFNNRLSNNMPLQSDISILYALGQHKELVTLSDLEVDSPYNLYKHTGYGPGPFNSPSEQAIMATLNPESHDYLYFVADTKTGQVYYSKTYEEHQELVEKYVNNKEN